MNNLLTSLLFLSLLFCGAQAFAQTDSLTLKNKHYIIGEIKSMDKGVLVIKTSYSKDDFRIKWDEIEGFFSEQSILLTSAERGRLYGPVISPELGKLMIDTEDFGQITLDFEEVLYVKPFDRRFLDRLNASIDLGFTMTRASNQRQFNLRSRLGYIAEKWSLDGTYNTLTTLQDEADEISRTDGDISYAYLLPKQWFVMARLDFLSNTEQRLELRTNYKLGGGKYLMRSNYMSWTAFAGTSFNNENFFGDENDRQSVESWFGSELNMFNTGDISIFSNVFVYPSLTESGRVRVDYKIDLKYDLPLDFYIKTGLTLNYDNQPAIQAGSTDFVWQTSFGWSW